MAVAEILEAIYPAPFTVTAPKFAGSAVST